MLSVAPVTAHHTGKALDLTVKKRFHILFWEQAAAAFEVNFLTLCCRHALVF